MVNAWHLQSDTDAIQLGEDEDGESAFSLRKKMSI
jgi:hypothetical protein